jgi:ssDNA thymidine ADP-ribosyltransferase, DarT
MSPPPVRPKIYHITHGKNLAKIIGDGCLWSDAEMIARGGPAAGIGMSHIKKRRLEELDVSCHPGTKVGQFVPFYFCPRSVMLYILHKGNNREMNYKEGQRPIVHLEADFYEVVDWANGQNRLWAFTNGNAGSRFFQSYSDPTQLDRLAWDHIPSEDFRDHEVKEAKQSEFLIFQLLPWSLVRTIGVMDAKIASRVREIVEASDHCPDVVVKRTWYI